jgi:hypothetical protein
MSQNPNFTDPQFVDANGTGGLNAAFGTVSGAIAAVGSGAWAAPGLISPESMTLSFSGLVASVGLPLPWGVVNASGTLVHAHGTQTGADTQSYSASFASLVPATGSVTAYLVATLASIQQNPFSIPGPPPGHPSYNPNYVPTIGYATNVDSVALTATSGVPDNISTFELLRTTLTPGQVSVASWNTSFQHRAVNRTALTASPVLSGGALTAPQAQGVLYANSIGLTNTLPPVSGCGGLVFRCENNTGGPWIISTNGSDRIAGLAGTATNSITIPYPGYVEFWGNAIAGLWDIKSSSPSASFLFASRSVTVSGNTSYDISGAGAYYTVAGSNTTQILPAASYVPGNSYGFFAASACTLTISPPSGSFTGNVFLGGSINGLSSTPMDAGDWISVQSNGVNYIVIAASPAIASIHGQQAFTGSTTFTVPSGIGPITARVWGGGGGGGGSNNTNGGGGGAGGNYSEILLTNIPGGTVLTLTVGSPGTGGTSGGGNGSAGTLSSIANGALTLVLANGGGGALGGSTSPFTGGVPGAAGTGTVQGTGAHGSGGGPDIGFVGVGGGAAMGGSGGGSAGTGAGAAVGGFPGGGGAGSGPSVFGAGANGGGGYIVLTW